MWGFPICDYDLKEYLYSDYDLQIQSQSEMTKAKHVFTHKIWDMTLFKVVVKEKVELDLPLVHWIKLEDLKEYALPTAFKVLLKDLL
jgi:A/G-specific adenine glycosylase